mgnify:CR=1 FL=1
MAGDKFLHIPDFTCFLFHGPNEENDNEEERVTYMRYSPSSSRRVKSPGSDLLNGHIPIKSLYEDDEFSVPVTGGTMPFLQLVKQV